MPSTGLLVSASGAFLASTPSQTDLEITGDLDLRAKLNVPNWTSSSSSSGTDLLAKGNPFSVFSWYINFFGASAGKLRLDYRTNIGENKNATATAVVPFDNDTDGWVRTTLDVNNGASGHTLTFYTSTDATDDPAAVSWSALGDPVVQSGTIALNNTSDALTNNGAKVGTHKVLEMRDGINGTVVLHVNWKTDPTAQAANGETFIDRTGNVWTWESGASLSDFVKPTLLGVAI